MRATVVCPKLSSGDKDILTATDPNKPFRGFAAHRWVARSIVCGAACNIAGLIWILRPNARRRHSRLNGPIAYKDIAHWDDYVEECVGISGQAWG